MVVAHLKGEVLALVNLYADSERTRVHKLVSGITLGEKILIKFDLIWIACIFNNKWEFQWVYNSIKDAKEFRIRAGV